MCVFRVQSLNDHGTIRTHGTCFLVVELEGMGQQARPVSPLLKGLVSWFCHKDNTYFLKACRLCEALRRRVFKGFTEVLLTPIVRE
jgi:hypothetical protein